MMRWAFTIVLMMSLGATTQPAATQPPADVSAIRRFIEAGHPELAESHAKDLIARGIYDPLAIGVMGYVYAQRGETGAAVQQLRMALLQAPDEPFLLSTAGQLVAWYDSTADRSRLTPTDVQMLEAIRMNCREKPAFADAYRATAMPPIAAPTGVPATTPQAPIIVQSPPVYVEQPQQPYYYDSSYYDPGFYYYPIYINPFFHDHRHDHDHGNHIIRSAPFGPPGHRGGNIGIVAPQRPGTQSPPPLRPPPTFRGMTPSRDDSRQRATDRSR